jgi:hypothetical protein
MAGQITISTLRNDTGVLATQNGMTGIAKAWIKYSYNGTTITINGSFNMGSVTRTAQGTYTFAFTTNMPDANYSVVTSQGLEITNGTSIMPVLFWNGADATPTTSSFVVRFIAPSNGVAYDPKVVGLVVNGN